MLSVDNKKREIFSDVQLDCPDKACGSWLRIFGSNKDTPAFTVCASEVAGQPPSCEAKAIFSKFASSCASCRLAIEVGEIICCRRSAKDRVWVHADCFEALRLSFALCQRCRALISLPEEATPSMCAGLQGFRHLNCSLKRKASYVQEDSLSQTTLEPAVSLASFSSPVTDTPSVS